MHKSSNEYTRPLTKYDYNFLSPGPEPATEMVFSNVTESSLTVSWSKPKAAFAGFRVTYTNIITGLPNASCILHLGSKSPYLSVWVFN